MSYSFPPCSIDLVQHFKDMGLSVCPQWIFAIQLGGYQTDRRQPFPGMLQKVLQQPTKCSCNHLHLCFAITYIFGLQLSTFLFYNKQFLSLDTCDHISVHITTSQLHKLCQISLRNLAFFTQSYRNEDPIFNVYKHFFLCIIVFVNIIFL